MDADSAVYSVAAVNFLAVVNVAVDFGYGTAVIDADFVLHVAVVV